MQSPREAIQALLRGEQAEFVPLYDNPWGDTMERWQKEGYPKDAAGKPLSAEECFGFAMEGCGGWFDWQAKHDHEEIVEESDEWRIVLNGNGAKHKWWKHKSGTPEHIDFHMTTRAIWDKDYRPHLVDNPAHRISDDDVTNTIQAIGRGREQGRWTHLGNMFIWEIIRASLGDVNMFMALLDDPEWIRDIGRVYTDLYKTCYGRLFDGGAIPDGIWVYEDLGYRDRLFCNPEILSDLIFPFYAELVEFIHGYDIPVVLHSCGYQAPMIPLAIDAGFDALNPMEVKAGNDIFDYAETYGDELVFVGGFDARILEGGDRPAIRAAVKNFMTGMKQRGARFVFGSDHSLSTDIAFKDFQYALDVYREYR